MYLTEEHVVWIRVEAVVDVRVTSWPSKTNIGGRQASHHARVHLDVVAKKSIPIVIMQCQSIGRNIVIRCVYFKLHSGTWKGSLFGRFWKYDLFRNPRWNCSEFSTSSCERKSFKLNSVNFNLTSRIVHVSEKDSCWSKTKLLTVIYIL